MKTDEFRTTWRIQPRWIRRPGGGFRSFKPKPVEVGKEYDVTISDVSRRGDGIAKIDGFVIFVAGAKQGQQVRVKVTQVSNRYASGQLVDGSMAVASSEGACPLR